MSTSGLQEMLDDVESESEMELDDLQPPTEENNGALVNANDDSKDESEPETELQTKPRRGSRRRIVTKKLSFDDATVNDDVSGEEDCVMEDAPIAEQSAESKPLKSRRRRRRPKKSEDNSAMEVEMEAEAEPEAEETKSESEAETVTEEDRQSDSPASENDEPPQPQPQPKEKPMQSRRGGRRRATRPKATDNVTPPKKPRRRQLDPISTPAPRLRKGKNVEYKSKRETIYGRIADMSYDRMGRLDKILVKWQMQSKDGKNKKIEETKWIKANSKNLTFPWRRKNLF